VSKSPKKQSTDFVLGRKNWSSGPRGSKTFKRSLKKKKGRWDTALVRGGGGRLSTGKIAFATEMLGGEGDYWKTDMVFRLRFPMTIPELDP